MSSKLQDFFVSVPGNSNVVPIRKVLRSSDSDPAEVQVTAADQENVGISTSAASVVGFLQPMDDYGGHVVDNLAMMFPMFLLW